MHYAIIHINDRAKENIDFIKKTLKDHKYIEDIKFFNGNKGNGWDVINHLGIDQTVWNPYDGRTFPPLPGELGVWISNINVWKYMIDNDIEELLVFEDDVSIDKDFLEKIILYKKELPKNFDFLALYFFPGQNQFDSATDIGAKNIHKSINQYAGAQCMLYSINGAKKILKALKRKGLEYTSDCFVFKQSQLGVINGYSIRPDTKQIIFHDYVKIKSTIDPKNRRQTDDL